jgi:hypothetical protein
MALYCVAVLAPLISPFPSPSRVCSYGSITLNLFQTSCINDFIRYRGNWKCSLGARGNAALCVDSLLLLHLEGSPMDRKGQLSFDLV